MAPLLAIVGAAFLYGAVKGRWARSRASAHEPPYRERSWLGIAGDALEEEVVFRAGANQVLGPGAGSVVFAMQHLASWMPLHVLAARAGDTLLGAWMYTQAYRLGAMHAPSPKTLTDSTSLQALLLGLGASTLAHTLHNVGVHLGAGPGRGERGL